MKVTAEAVAPEGVTEKPATRYIATSGTFPGYWGAHKDGPHHAIVECLAAGASRGGIFVVYEAYEGCGIDGMGRTTYLVEHGDPFEKPEGVYDATGAWLGDDLNAVAAEFQRGDWQWRAEETILSKETVKSLRSHKPE